MTYSRPFSIKKFGGMGEINEGEEEACGQTDTAREGEGGGEQGCEDQPCPREAVEMEDGCWKVQKEEKYKNLNALKILREEYDYRTVITILVPEEQPSPPPGPSNLRDNFGAILNKVYEAGYPAQYQEYWQEWYLRAQKRARKFIIAELKIIWFSDLI
jgi:hypothetical protein